MNDEKPVAFAPTNDPESEGDGVESGEPRAANAPNRRKRAEPMEDWEYYF